jgi:Lipocalin-like domain
VPAFPAPIVPSDLVREAGMNTVRGSNAVVGAWRLVSWENRAADGEVSYLMGTDALGYLLYTADGRFSVTISRRGRPGFAAGDLLGGTTEEQARAVQDFVAYTGQERWVELAGRQLILSASPLLLAGKRQVPRLVWERVDPGA